MCGRFSQAERIDRIAELFGADPDPGLPDGGYNIAPTDPIRIVRDITGSRRISAARWGFRPFWLGPERGPGWINARAETAADSPAFGPALRTSRCVIPADAFYEWDRAHRPPQPYAIGPAEGGLVSLAGLWTGTERGEGISATILTTTPNRSVARLHHRMPVILDPDGVDAWLTPDSTPDELMPLLVPAAEGALRIWPVSTAVNRVGTDGPQLLSPSDVLPGTLGLA